MKKFLALILTLFITFILTACTQQEAGGNSNQDEQVDSNEHENTDESYSNIEENEESNSLLSLGDTFEFKDLEMTIGIEIGWTTIGNRFSDKD